MSQPSEHEIEVFNIALELPAGERAAYLDRECVGDAALRQRVEELLKANEVSCACLEGLAAAPPGTGGAVRSSPVPAEKPGDHIGRYKLLEQIGEGGCGVVYMAEQEEPVRRRVALKVIKLGMDTKSVIARFEAEWQALALMDHPNIAKVLDAGATDAGRPFFVMELVKAVPITRYCDEHNLSTMARLSLFVQVCQAVQHAHQKGIIHRDIKPSNIMVADHDGVPVPKIIDFGIAKATTDQRLTDKTVFTAFEQFIGTPAYMSPEQAKLSGLDIDTRSDIYSLGVLLYELLTGKTPFDAKRLLEAGLDEVRRIIREEEPMTPSTKLHTLNAAEQTTVAKHRQSEPPKLEHLIRGDLDWIVMKALEKDRARRYETANGLAADIKRHLENEPVIARPPSVSYRLQKSFRRNRLAFATCGIVAAALLLGVMGSTWQAVRATKAEKLAEHRLAEVAAERDAKEEARKEAEAISTILTQVFISPSPYRDGRTITVAETLSNATQKLETELADQPARRAKLLSAIGATYYGLGLFYDAISLQEKARDYYLAASGPESLDTLVATRRVANLYTEVGRLDEAIKLLEQVLTLSRKALGPEHPETINVMQILAGTYNNAGRRDEALKLREESLALSRKVNGPENGITIELMEELAISHLQMGHLRESIPLGEQVLALSAKVLGPEHRQTLRCMYSLGASYYADGRRDAALKLWEQALPLDRKVNGPEHPLTLKVMSRLAVTYGEVGRHDEALKLSEQVLAINRKFNGPDHPDTLEAMQVLAISYDHAGRHEEAIKLLQEALELSSKRLGAEHPITLSTMGTLSFVLYEAGRRDDAIKLGEQVLALKSKKLGPEHYETLGAMENLAIFYDAAGQRAESLKLKEQALALTRKALGSQHPITLQAMNDLAWIQATSEAAEIRNGTNAVLLAEEAVAATHRKNPGFLDTLAASYAEARQFDKAAAAQLEAIGLAKSDEEKKDYASRLKLYQAKNPYRVKANP